MELHLSQPDHLRSGGLTALCRSAVLAPAGVIICFLLKYFNFHLNLQLSATRQTLSALSPWTRYPVRRLLTFLKALTPSTQDLVRRLTTTTTKTIKRYRNRIKTLSISKVNDLLFHFRKLKLSTSYKWNTIHSARETK